MAGKRNYDFTTPEADPRFHDTYKFLRRYRDATYSLKVVVHQLESQFRMEYGTSVDEFLDSIYAAGVELGDGNIAERAKSIEKLVPHINNISYRTYYRKRHAAIEALSTILWGFTTKETMNVLNQFFPG